MDYIHLRVNKATTATGVAYVTPPDASAVWRLKAAGFVPHVASAANGTNYQTIVPKKGSTALATARDTSSTGLTAGTVVNFGLTATGSDLEFTQAAPLILSHTASASGVAIDVDWALVFEVVR